MALELDSVDQVAFDEGMLDVRKVLLNPSIEFTKRYMALLNLK